MARIYLRDPTKKSVEELVKLIIEIVMTLDAAWIFVDALDEFSNAPQERLALVHHLLRIRNAAGPHRFRLCITSREANDVWTSLQPATEIRIRPVAEDIATFVKSEIEKASGSKKWIMADPQLPKTIVSTILDRSDQIFKLASLQAAAVLSQMNVGPLKRALRNLKSDMDVYYQASAERLQKNAQDPNDVDYKYVIKLLTWIIHASKSGRVYLHQMRHALAADEVNTEEGDVMEDFAVDVQLLASISEGLITITSLDTKFLGDPSRDNLQVLSLAHETVSSFFANNPAYLISDCDGYIAKTCIAYMSLPGPSESLGNRYRFISVTVPRNAELQCHPVKVHARHWFNDEDAEEMRAAVLQYPFLHWAAGFWGDYVEDCSADTAAVVRDFVKR